MTQDILLFEDSLKAVSVADIQDAVEKAIGELIGRKTKCSISVLELKPLQGVHVNMWLSGVLNSSTLS